MEQMAKQAENMGTRIIYDTITKVDLLKYPFVLYGDSGTQYCCDALIIATGAQARWLGLESEKPLWEEVFLLVLHVMAFLSWEGCHCGGRRKYSC